jgi:hypothetical protein
VITKFGLYSFRRASVRIDSIFSDGANGELKTLLVAITKFDVPDYGIRSTHRLNHAAQRGDVSIATAFYSVLRASLNTGITFPALLWFLVVGFHCMACFRTVDIETHQVVRTTLLIKSTVHATRNLEKFLIFLTTAVP